MVKVIVIYDSTTGNTESMAREVARGAAQVDGAEVKIKKADYATLEDLLSADGIIMGSPTYYGGMSAKLKALFDSSVKIHGKLMGKVGAAFTSSGGTSTGSETTLLSILQAMLVHGMIVQGRADEKHYGAAAVGSPKKEAVKYCQDLGRNTASLAKKLYPG